MRGIVDKGINSYSLPSHEGSGLKLNRFLQFVPQQTSPLV